MTVELMVLLYGAWFAGCISFGSTIPGESIPWGMMIGGAVGVHFICRLISPTSRLESLTRKHAEELYLERSEGYKDMTERALQREAEKRAKKQVAKEQIARVEERTQPKTPVQSQADPPWDIEKMTRGPQWVDRGR